MSAGAVTALEGRARALAVSVAIAPRETPMMSTNAPAPPHTYPPALRIVFGDHPVPGQRSLAAAEAIGEIVAAVHPGDHVIVLISGGGSSLAAAPAAEVEGFSQADLSQLYETLLASGADIHLVNAVRKRFARWAGGRLAVALSHARLHCLAVSDVPGDDPGAISSGPCAGDPMDSRTLLATLHANRLWPRLPRSAQLHLEAAASGRVSDTPKPDAPAFRHVTTRVIVSNRHALETAAARARAAGIEEVTIEPVLLTGEAAIAGVRMASDLIARRKRARGPRVARCVLWGGETTVTIRDDPAVVRSDSAGPPLGGRCQELALAAARSLAEAGDHALGIMLLAAGTDGRDGPTDAAGAIVDSSTWVAIATAGRDPADDLAHHEAYRALDAAGALIRPGLTGTNVMDVAIGLIL